MVLYCRFVGCRLRLFTKNPAISTRAIKGFATGSPYQGSLPLILLRCCIDQGSVQRGRGNLRVVRRVVVCCARPCGVSKSLLFGGCQWLLSLVECLCGAKKSFGKGSNNARCLGWVWVGRQSCSKTMISGMVSVWIAGLLRSWYQSRATSTQEKAIKFNKHHRM